MGRYFTDEVIDEVIKIWEETHPGAIERAHDVMNHPDRDNNEAMARNWRDFRSFARSLPFFSGQIKHNTNFDFEIHIDVFHRIGDMLGPIGTRSISD